MELIPLALSLLAFLVCLIIAIVYVVRQKDQGKRITGIILAFCSMLLLFPFVPIIPRVGITQSNLAGTYEGTVGGYRERLVLHANGKFEQRLTSADGHAYDDQGTWDVSDSLWGEVGFNNILMSDDSSVGKPDLGTLTIGVRGYDGALIFNDDTDEHLSRVR
jgi:hypothetical protein